MAYPFLTFGKFLKVLKHEIFFGPENFSGKIRGVRIPKSQKLLLIILYNFLYEIIHPTIVYPFLTLGMGERVFN